METVGTGESVRNSLLRTIVVICATTALGLLIFQLSVVNMRMMASQFLTSGVSAGISYAAVKSRRWRDGLAALLVWYLVMVFLVTEYNSWLLVLWFAYVAGIAAAVSLYDYFVRKDIVRGMVQRVAAAGVIVAVANALIVLFLGFFSVRAVIASPGSFASAVFRNLQFGTLIGIGFGLGAEIAEYGIRRMTHA
jgi:signal transduction histidine kinase